MKNESLSFKEKIIIILTGLSLPLITVRIDISPVSDVFPIKRTLQG